MPILTWKSDYSVGVRQIDDEHMKLIDMINKAYDAVVDGREQDVLAELVADMREYALTHFASEEKLMREYGYPHLETHRLQHDEFMIEAATANKSAGSGGAALRPEKIFKFLGDWLRQHILSTDKEVGAFLRSRGID